MLSGMARTWDWVQCSNKTGKGWIRWKKLIRSLECVVCAQDWVTTRISERKRLPYFVLGPLALSSLTMAPHGWPPPPLFFPSLSHYSRNRAVEGSGTPRAITASWNTENTQRWLREAVRSTHIRTAHRRSHHTSSGLPPFLLPLFILLPLRSSMSRAAEILEEEHTPAPAPPPAAAAAAAEVNPFAPALPADAAREAERKLEAERRREEALAHRVPSAEATPPVCPPPHGVRKAPHSKHCALWDVAKTRSQSRRNFRHIA